MRGPEQRPGWLRKHTLEPIKKEGIFGRLAKKVIPYSWKLGLAGVTVSGGIQGVRPPDVTAEPLHQQAIVRTVPSRDVTTPENTAEVTQSLVLEANKFEGALGARLSDAWQDESSNWNIAYDNAVLRRDADGKLAFRPVVGEFRDMELANLIEQDLGVAVPVLFDEKRSTDPESAFQESARLLGVPQNVVGTVSWLRTIAETGPFTSTRSSEDAPLTFTTDSIAIQDTEGSPTLAAIGRLAVNLGLVPQGTLLKTPDIGSGGAPEVQPPASESPAEILPWPERFGDLERDGIEFINKGEQQGLRPGNEEFYRNLLWRRDNYAKYPSIKRRIVLFHSLEQLQKESTIRYDPNRSTVWLWDVWARSLVLSDNNGQFIEVLNYPPTFRPGEIRWQQLPDGTLEFHFSLPDPLPGATPHERQLLTLSIVGLGERLPIERMLFSEPDGSLSGDSDSKYFEARNSSEMKAHPIGKSVPSDDGTATLLLPFYITSNKIPV